VVRVLAFTNCLDGRAADCIPAATRAIILAMQETSRKARRIQNEKTDWLALANIRRSAGAG